MIIYLKTKLEVKLGDTIDVSGINVTITEDLISNNPNMFETKEEFPDYVECIELVNGNAFPAIGDILIVDKPAHPNCSHYVHGVCRAGGYSYNKCFKPYTEKA